MICSTQGGWQGNTGENKKTDKINNIKPPWAYLICEIIFTEFILFLRSKICGNFQSALGHTKLLHRKTILDTNCHTISPLCHMGNTLKSF